MTSTALPQSAVATAGPAMRPKATGATPPLIVPAAEIFDADAVAAALSARTGAAEAAPKVMRTAAVEILGAARRQGMDRIAAAVAERPFASAEAVAAYAHLADGIVTTAFALASQRLHPARTAKDAEKLSLLAVGGFGRGEMAPFSDIDLLFLTPWKITPWAESVIESMLYILWDLRLKVGHASRTVSECLRLARADITIRTSLLEHRPLAGNAALAWELGERLRTELFATTNAEFIEAKLAERTARHQKQGGQRYIVEPNVKEGKGGLRDLQSLFWIAKYVHNVDSTAELVAAGTFTSEEYERFADAQSFLWSVRNQLHLLAGRAMDQLSFDKQVEVAAALSYSDRDGRRAVEHFMQDYFRHATTTGELTRILLAKMEASHVKKAPSLIGFFKRRKPVRPGFALIQNRLAFADGAEALADKLAFLRIFDEALRTGYLLHPDAMRLIAANLSVFDDALRRNPEAAKIFLSMLLKRGNPERGLRRMNELGVLGAFIPEFQPVVAMMQFNMYHHFTVDEHTIQCISTLSKIERGELAETLPFATRILRERGANRKVIYVALLLHDVGKGRKEDHSILGARIARQVAPRLGLKPDETATVEWLVRYHLLMSDMAQKRDISDPRTVRDFAKAVKTQRRLDLLSLLTCCDIIGVGPGVWNNWKAVLMRGLYRQTSEALATGLEDLNREAREDEARAALRKALPDWQADAMAREQGRHYGPYWQGLPVEAHVIFAQMLDGLADDEIRIELDEDAARDATRICIAMADHPGIFARLAGSLALVGANVVDARSFTSKDGYATAAFWVQDADGAPYASGRMDRLKTMICRNLMGEVVTGDEMARRDRLKRRERAIVHPTSISFDNEGSEIYTIIEVDTRDRPGLLYDLARTLAAANVRVSSAQIATYGAQAVDTFYVKDSVGLKLGSTRRRAQIEQRLREAVAQGARRAQQ